MKKKMYVSSDCRRNACFPNTCRSAHFIHLFYGFIAFDDKIEIIFHFFRSIICLDNECKHFIDLSPLFILHFLIICATGQLSECLSSSDNQTRDGGHTVVESLHLDEIIRASNDSTPVCTVFLMSSSLPFPFLLLNRLFQ